MFDGPLRGVEGLLWGLRSFWLTEGGHRADPSSAFSMGPRAFLARDPRAPKRPRSWAFLTGSMSPKWGPGYQQGGRWSLKLNETNSP